jgi:hypothetical protein
VRRRALSLLILLVALAALAAGLSSVAGARDDDVRRSGNCTRGSDWKLKLSHEDGRIEVEYEVDQNRSGVRWVVRLRHNGSQFARTVRRTRPPSGSFEVRRLVGNRAGTDRISATATRRAETCRGSASI